jgi:hypothetical protein
MSDEITALKAEIEALRKDRDHWRANHDNQVLMKRALLDRPDLGDRAKTVQALFAQLEILQAEFPIAQKRLKDWEEMFEAFAQLPLPADVRTRQLWPNQWHQDCAAIAFALHNLAKSDE